MPKIVSTLVVLGAVALGSASGTGSPATVPTGPDPVAFPMGCPDRAGDRVVLGTSSSAAGDGIWVAASGDLERLSGDGALEVTDDRAVAASSVRHVASVPGVGLAFVEDGAGTDTVVMDTAAGVVRIPQREEAVNPALSPRGDLVWSVGTQIRIRRAASGGIRRLPVPVPGSLAFSPVFVPGGDLVVALAHPPTAAVPEDERLDDLWRVTPDGRWRRLTSFTAGADRWTAVRTPVAAPGGGVDFVLVRGRGSATREPRFDLMHLRAGGLTRLRHLDREMYLAGFDGRARLWNMPDIAAGRIDLVRESRDGHLTVIGCGATLMDPIDVADPDRAVGAAGAVPPEAPTPTQPDDTSESTWARAPSPTQPDGTAAATWEVGILVGDFAARSAAETAAASVRATLPGGAAARVVDAVTAPHALRPGVYGVLLPLAAGADPQHALATFREALPELAASSWVVTA
jgi:hypothetical protein